MSVLICAGVEGFCCFRYMCMCEYSNGPIYLYLASLPALFKISLGVSSIKVL